MDPGQYERLLVDLVRAEVRFLVVGGVACMLNGVVRTTEDVDILVDADPVNVRRLLDALAGFGEGHARELAPSDFADEEGAIRLVEDFPIDIFTRMGGLRYADMLRYRRTTAGASAIPYLDADGLIRLKRGSLREQDRIDADVLQRMKDAGAFD
jgi:hypothetical protein